MTTSTEGTPEPPLPEGAVVDNEPIGEPVDDTPDHVIVEFKGTAPYYREFISGRKISRADFSRISIDSPGDLAWNPLNDWKQSIGVEYNALIAWFRKDKAFTVHTAS